MLVPPTETPTLTPVPPTATAVPPSPTTAPPTATAVPPTATPAPVVGRESLSTGVPVGLGIALLVIVAVVYFLVVRKKG